MRVFGRFLYALLAVGLFLLVFTYSIDLTANKFYEEVFGTSLVDEDSTLPEFYYFYTSIPDFHKADPIISVDKNGYIIRGYEIAQAKIENDELIVSEYVYIIVYSSDQDLSKVDKIKLLSDSELMSEFYLTRFKTLNILNGVNETGNVYLEKSFFLDANISAIELISDSQQILLSELYSVEETSFTIKENLETFYQEYKRVPLGEDLDLLEDDNIGIKIVHTNEENKLDGSILLVGMVGYFLVLIITTYLIFFRKGKYS